MMEAARRSGGPALPAWGGADRALPTRREFFFPGPIMGVPMSSAHMLESYISAPRHDGHHNQESLPRSFSGFWCFLPAFCWRPGGHLLYRSGQRASSAVIRGGPGQGRGSGQRLYGQPVLARYFSNIAGTGSITIPTMKKAGYPSTSGAIEACRFPGGVVMPPGYGRPCLRHGHHHRRRLCRYHDSLRSCLSLLFYFGLILQACIRRAHRHQRHAEGSRPPPQGAEKRWPFLFRDGVFF